MPSPWQRSFILFSAYNTAGCCTFCDVRCVYMCCNKIRVIRNVYKRRLLINIIGETSASPLFTTERIQPEYSSFSIFLDDNKLNRAAHTMPEVPPHKYRTSGLDIGYVPAGPHAFFRSSGQFGPQQFILCWPAGPVAFRSVANACCHVPVFYVDVSRVAVRWFDLQVFSSTELFYLYVLV